MCDYMGRLRYPLWGAVAHPQVISLGLIYFNKTPHLSTLSHFFYVVGHAFNSDALGSLKLEEVGRFLSFCERINVCGALWSPHIGIKDSVFHTCLPYPIRCRAWAAALKSPPYSSKA